MKTITNFSFSSIKSSFINTVHNANQKGETLNKNNLATSFQQAVVDVLVVKTIRAAKEYGVKQVVLPGGVASNTGLRHDLKNAVKRNSESVNFVIPPLSLCGDNAAMIQESEHS